MVSVLPTLAVTPRFVKVATPATALAVVEPTNTAPEPVEIRALMTAVELEPAETVNPFAS